MRHHELAQLLDALPVNMPVSFMQAQVCLTMANDGATLSAEIDQEYSAQLQESLLELGFSWALEFDAGLATQTDQHHLVLLQWLPGVDGWVSAAAALGKLLDQLESCRRERADRRDGTGFEVGDHVDFQAHVDFQRSRDEQRFRKALLR
jgi:predicted secreted protein